MSKTTLSKRERGVTTPPRWARLADQEAAGEDHRAWHAARVADHEKRRKAATEAKVEAGPQGGRARALALFGDTPVTRAAVEVARDRRGRALPYVNPDKDRRLAGKARIRARRAARR